MPWFKKGEMDIFLTDDMLSMSENRNLIPVRDSDDSDEEYDERLKLCALLSETFNALRTEYLAQQADQQSELMSD